MSELEVSVLMREKMLFSGEIYTTGKYFTMPPAVTGVTNITSGGGDQKAVFLLLYICIFVCGFCFCRVELWLVGRRRLQGSQHSATQSNPRSDICRNQFWELFLALDMK